MVPRLVDWYCAYEIGTCYVTMLYEADRALGTTDKTRTIAELIKQAAYVRKYKMLATNSSNVAVDNVLSRLIPDQSTNKTKQSKQKDRLAR